VLDGTKFTDIKSQISQDVMLHRYVTRPYMWSTAHMAVIYSFFALSPLLYLCSYSTYAIHDNVIQN